MVTDAKVQVESTSLNVAETIMKTAHTLKLLFALQLGGAICPAGEVTIGRFATADYGDWKAIGDAFKKGPAFGELLKTLEIENAGGAPIASSEIDGDGPTGTLSSPAFNISQPYIAFRIGGGDYEMHACIDLLVDGKVVKRALEDEIGGFHFAVANCPRDVVARDRRGVG